MVVAIPAAGLALAAALTATGAHGRMTMSATASRVTLHGEPMALAGEPPAIGRPAPEATLVDNDLKPVRLSSFRGRVLLLGAVPSLDTPVCDLDARRFNEEAAALGENVRVLVISMDLPFAQKRWCGAAGADRLTVLSDHREAAFGRACGVLIERLRLPARALFVLDRDGGLRYAQIVPEVSQEPDYEAALNAVRALL